MPSSPVRIATIIGILTAVVVAFLIAFALPGINSTPQNVPIALAASPGMASSLETQIEEVSPGTFDVTIVENPEDITPLVEDREVYGGFALSQSGLEIQVASAASYAVSGLIEQAGHEFAAEAGRIATVTDVVAFSSDDPRGMGLSAGALPISLGGWIAAVAILSTIRGTRQRLLTAAGFAVVGGFALTAVLQYVFHTVTGNFALTALAVALGTAATSYLVLGLQRAFKGAGIALAAVILVVFGNPLSGMNSAPELLPAPWGAIGQLLPPGATGTLIRNTAFFDGAQPLAPLAVLIAWALFGLALYAFGHVRDNRSR